VSGIWFVISGILLFTMNVALASSTSLRKLVVRAVLRKSSGPRHSSSSAEKKGQDAFSEAQKVAGKAWENVSRVLGPTGQRIGNLLGSKCNA